MLLDQKNRVREYQKRQKRNQDLITLGLIIAIIITLELLRR